MHTIQIIDGDKTHTFSGPSAWSECTSVHLLELGRSAALKMTTIKARILLAMKLYGIPRRLFAKIDMEQRRAIVALTIFIESQKVIEHNLFPSFRLRFRKYHGPNEQFDNVQSLEFAYAELSYIAYIETRNHDFLDDLIAILYRPRRYFGIKNDIRTDFYERSANIRAKRFKKLPVQLKYAILLNYEGWRNWIIARYPVVFEGPDPEDDAEVNTGSVSNSSLWTRIYRMIAESGVFGTYEQVCNQQIIVLFAQLSDKILEAKKAKEELEKMRR